MQEALLSSRRPLCLPILFGFICFTLLPLSAQSPQAGSPLPPPAAATVDYRTDIEPLLRSRCYLCHGEGQQINGLRLDRKTDALSGGYSGPVMLPGKSGESRLIQLVAGADSKVVMPPVGERLTAAEVGLLRAWIDQGISWPDAVDTAAAETEASKSRHWSFQPVARPRLPRVGNPQWVRNPIDRFVLAKLDAEGVKPSPAAGMATLVRRLSLDLTGLPPAPEEVERFLLDNRPDAYEKLVDRLLDSQHYGEKWARHWLDQARYADSDGYEKDLSRPHAWRYRHWVIDALNHDMPFDRFTLEQIAGDLLEDGSVESRVATGFHRNTLKNREGGINLEQTRFEETIDRTNTVATVWLGLSVECAQCHDHKYDPISQRDYYRLYAFFNSVDEVDIDAPLAGEWGPYFRKRPGYLAERARMLAEHDVPELQKPWEAKLLEAAKQPGVWTDWDLSYDILPLVLDHGHRILHKPPQERTGREQYGLTRFFIRNYHRVIPEDRYEELRFKELSGKLDELDKEFPDVSRAMTVHRREQPRPTNVHLRGQWDRTGLRVAPDTPGFLPPLRAEAQATRVDLARWLVSRGNPLTARVTVNRIWQEYFGRGLVLTSEDFGTRGERPTHPQLLDWLAVEFMEQGWSLKKLHKRIVTSSTYRQSSNVRPELQQRDPDNELLARQARVRLPAELIRDSALAVSGLLYPKIGGRSVRPPMPQGVADLSYANSVKWNESEGRGKYRRGLYVHFQRTVPYPFLMNFDAPETRVTQCRRERSNTPLQALNLLNDPVFFEAARALAARILIESSGSSFDDRLEYAYRLCVSRLPGATERQGLRAYYDQRKAELAGNQDRLASLFPAGIDGVDKREAAAWVGLSRVLLNTDEFITRE